MSRARVCFVDDPGWDVLVEACSFHDTYHHSIYHRAMASGGRPVLVASDDGPSAPWALPVVLRPIAEALPGASGVDAISVYGFTGLAWSPGRVEEYRWSDVWRALRDALLELGVVSAFIRLHPLDSYSGPWPQDCEVVEGGPTVVLAPLLGSEEGLNGYRKAHRYDVRRALREGLRVTWSRGDERLHEFVELYEDTMRRRGAAPSYFFDSDDLRKLFSSAHFDTWMGAVEDSRRVLAMSLFLAHPPIAQYFLSGGTRTEHGSRPSKLLIHQARRHLGAMGCSTLHLGGGVGSHLDSLFEFKSGFSEDRAVFRSLRWIVDPPRYAACIAKLSEAASTPGPSARDWFPAYRAPRPPSS